MDPAVGASFAFIPISVRVGRGKKNPPTNIEYLEVRPGHQDLVEKRSTMPQCMNWGPSRC